MASANDVCCNRTNLRRNTIHASLEGDSRDGQPPYLCKMVREEVGHGQDYAWGKKE